MKARKLLPIIRKAMGQIEDAVRMSRSPDEIAQAVEAITQEVSTLTSEYKVRTRAEAEKALKRLNSLHGIKPQEVEDDETNDKKLKDMIEHSM